MECRNTKSDSKPVYDGTKKEKRQGNREEENRQRRINRQVKKIRDTAMETPSNNNKDNRAQEMAVSAMIENFLAQKETTKRTLDDLKEAEDKAQAAADKEHDTNVASAAKSAASAAKSAKLAEDIRIKRTKRHEESQTALQKTLQQLLSAQPQTGKMEPIPTPDREEEEKLALQQSLQRFLSAQWQTGKVEPIPTPEPTPPLSRSNSAAAAAGELTAGDD